MKGNRETEIKGKQIKENVVGSNTKRRKYFILLRVISLINIFYYEFR
jgi:hypothetical protein